MISLGIGDTTEPLPSCVAEELARKARQLGSVEGYSGYGPEEGERELRKLIAHQMYQDRFASEEIFISDGTNSDIGRLQVLFGSHATIAVQDPTYPAYVDVSVILGQTAAYDPSARKYRNITYMPCLPERAFFPPLQDMEPVDILYFCSPNNPTGATASRAQLEELVDFARRHHTIIVYDTAYASYIQDDRLPRSIYQIKGAEEVAIELGSFSKMAGFTGVRLGWSVVPKELRFEEGHSVRDDWNRVHTTLFNGASNIAQAGGLAVLQSDGREQIKSQIAFYMENAAILRAVLDGAGYEVYGGEHAPYLWVRFPFASSWETFDRLLEGAQLVTAPGSGFGPAGEGFVRFSAFGSRADIEEAAGRLRGWFARR